MHASDAYSRELFVGLFLGYMYCKHQDHCNDVASKFTANAEMFRRKTVECLSKDRSHLCDEATMCKKDADTLNTSKPIE